MNKRINIISLLFFSIVLLKAQSWGILGSGLSNQPYFFKEYNGKLLIGGPGTAGGITVNGIATFDGVKFDSVGEGACAQVFTLEIYKNEIYAGGDIYWSGDCSLWPQPINELDIIRWNGSDWYSVGTGVNYVTGQEEIRAFAIYNGELYVGGSFLKIGGVNTAGLAKWDGTNWTAVNCPPGFNLYAMAVYKGELYIGGDVALNCIVPNPFGYGIARWNGTQWDSVGGPVSGVITAMVVDTINNYLYVGGSITNVAGVPCFSVARWDSTNWTSPGGFGITNGATSMCMFNNELYVGGYWTQGLQTDTVLAKFDGTSWSQVLGPHTTVTALGVYDSNLYVGGYFDSVGTMKANYIACYGNTCPQGVGIQELQGSSLKFKVYPNPARNEITISVNDDVAQDFVLKVTSNLGQVVVKQKFNKELKIDTSKFPKDFYLVEVCTAEGVVCHTEKVIIE